MSLFLLIKRNGESISLITIHILKDISHFFYFFVVEENYFIINLKVVSLKDFSPDVSSQILVLRFLTLQHFF
jgi:hypothetical protein